MIFPKWISVGEAAQAMTVVNGLMLIHSIFTQLEPIIMAAFFSLVSLGVSFGLMRTSAPPPPLAEKVINDKQETSLKELTTPEEAVALVWARLKSHVNTEKSFPASFYKSLKESEIAYRKESASFDESLFEESILPLGLKDMSAPVAKSLLLQATTSTGKLMTVTELLQLMNEPKYSADGRLSRLERGSRSLSMDSVISEVLKRPVHLKSKSSRAASRSASINIEMSEVLNRPEHLKSESSRAALRSASTDIKMTEVLDNPAQLKSKPSRTFSRSVSPNISSVLVHLTSKPGHAFVSPPSKSETQKEVRCPLVPPSPSLSSAGREVELI